MHSTIKKNLPKILLMVAAVSGVSGCAPGPPVPPLFGPGNDLVVFLGLGGIVLFLWLYFDSKKSPDTTHAAEILNDIHQQLKRLEEKIEKVEKQCKKKNGGRDKTDTKALQQ